MVKNATSLTWSRSFRRWEGKKGEEVRRNLDRVGVKVEGRVWSVAHCCRSFPWSVFESSWWVIIRSELGEKYAETRTVVLWPWAFDLGILLTLENTRRKGVERSYLFLALLQLHSLWSPLFLLNLKWTCLDFRLNFECLFELRKTSGLWDEACLCWLLAEAFLIEVGVWVRIWPWARYCIFVEFIFRTGLTLFAFMMDQYSLFLKLLALLRRRDIITVTDSGLILIGLKGLLIVPMFNAVQSLVLVGDGSIEGETSLSCCLGLLSLFVEIGRQALHFLEVGRLLANWMDYPRKEMVGILCLEDSGKFEIIWSNWR